jgi:hypothetical protein
MTLAITTRPATDNAWHAILARLRGIVGAGRVCIGSPRGVGGQVERATHRIRLRDEIPATFLQSTINREDRSR